MALNAADTNIYRCTPRQIRVFIMDCLEAGLVPFVRSSPGCGKSEIMRAIAEELGLKMIDHRLSTSDPTDMSGLPRFTSDGFAEFAPFRQLFPLEGTELPKGYEGWLLFLDEFNSAQKQVQAASYKTILDHAVGQYPLHERVLISLAGNLDTDRAITNPVSTALESRVVHLELVVNFDDWETDVAIPRQYDPRIIAFLRQYPDHLLDFKPDHQEKTYCCPRTWDFMNRLINGKPVTSTKVPLYAGTITAGTAAEFAEHCQIYKDLVNVREILADPAGCRIPEGPNSVSLKWATVSHMTQHVNDNTFSDLSQYANRFSLDFRILFYRSVMVRHKNAFRHHPAFGKAAIELSKYLNTAA